MSFLKHVGQLIAKGLGLLHYFGPVLSAVVPGAGVVVSELAQIGNVILNIEGAFNTVTNAKGEDKLRAAGPLVAQVLRASELVAGRKIADEAKFLAASATIAGGVADLVNSLEAPK